VPVLIVHSERALTPDLAHGFYSAVKSPKHEPDHVPPKAAFATVQVNGAIYAFSIEPEQ
jgi:hypothetical protein